MAIFNVGFCLFVPLVIVSMSLVQGRSLRRRHGHHSHSNYYNFEESLPRDLSRRLEDDLEYYLDFYGQRSREYPQVSSEYEEDSEEQTLPSLRRYNHEYGLRGREFLRRKDSLRKYNNFDGPSTGFVARRKRHNKQGTSVNYQRFAPKNLSWRSIHEFELNSSESASFELEVKEAQNSSICNYTVESIPDTRGSRIPKDLEHVRCNHIGSSCQGAGTYCCIQTYRNIEVTYGDGDKETMKLYIGCVCALQVFNNVINSQLSIND